MPFITIKNIQLPQKFRIQIIIEHKSDFLINSRESSSKLIKIKTISDDKIGTLKSHPINYKVLWLIRSIN